MGFCEEKNFAPSMMESTRLSEGNPQSWVILGTNVGRQDWGGKLRLGRVAAFEKALDDREETVSREVQIWEKTRKGRGTAWLCGLGRAAPVPGTCTANLGGIWETTVPSQPLAICSNQTRPMELGDFPFQGLMMIRVWALEFRSRPQHLPDAWPWVSYSVLLCLNFLICQTMISLLLTSWVHHEDHMSINICKAPRIVPGESKYPINYYFQRIYNYL